MISALGRWGRVSGGEKEMEKAVVRCFAGVGG